MEEFQVYFELPDQEANKAIADLLSFIIAVGPSAGRHPRGPVPEAVRHRRRATCSGCSTATATTTPPASRSSAATGTCPIAVLGTDAYGEGHRRLPRCPSEAKGVGILYGASDETPTVRVPPRRQRRRREDPRRRAPAPRAGRDHHRIRGRRDDPAPRAGDVLADALAVFGADNGLHWDVLADRLAASPRTGTPTPPPTRSRPRAATAACPSVDVRYPAGRAGAVRKGCRRDDLEGADGAR